MPTSSIRIGRALTGLVFVGLVAGCGADDGSAVTGDDAYATAGATRIVKSLEGPGNLAIVGDSLVFSTAHFDASGDPELDQQFASWRGTLWQRPLAGGAKKKVADTVGAVMSTASVGKSLLVVDSGYLGVTKITFPSGKETDFYNDFSHFPDEGEDLPTLGGVAAGKSGVYVTRPGSEVLHMNTDGSKVTTFAKTWKSGWVESAEKVVVTDEAVFWTTDKQGETGSTYNLYRATLGTTAPKPVKLASYDGQIRSLATDGENAFVAVEKKGDTDGFIAVATPTSKSARTLVAAQSHADNLVYDERFGLFFSEWATGVLLVDEASLDSAGEQSAEVVLPVKNVTSLAVGKTDLYVADDPGEINEKKGEILRMSLSKLAQD
jgi:hypothetical protein